MIAKSFVFAAAATVFIHLFTQALPRCRYLAAAVLTGLFAFPFNFHNLLWAFQSQFDFFLLSVAMGWLALQRDRPVAALVIAVLSLFTLGGGPILAASYVPFCVWAGWDKRWSWRKSMGITAAAVAIAAFGVSLRAEHSAPLATPREQATAVAAYLAWPHSGLVALVDRLPETERLFPRPVLNFPSAESSWLRQVADVMHDRPAAVTILNALCALILLAPTAVVFALVIIRRIRGSAIWGALGLAGFAFLMQVATGVARAREVGIPVRYLDVVALSGFTALACAFALAAHVPSSRRLMIGWAVFTAPACLAIVVGTMATLKQRRSQAWLENVRQYFPSHDPAILHGIIAKDPHWPLPFISRDIEHLMTMLDDPAYLTIVPRSVVAQDEPPRMVAQVASALGRFGFVFVIIGVGGAACVVRRLRREQFGVGVARLVPKTLT
jgi:hypothetical protein